MAYRIVVTAEARRNLLALPKDVLRRVDACIRALAATPRPRRTKRIKGVPDLWRVRVGDYRILYTIEDRNLLIVVVRVGHRRDVYR